jgi:hypothetical protein
LTACSNFLNMIRLGLGVEPDFEPPPGFEQNKVHLPEPAPVLQKMREPRRFPWPQQKIQTRGW